MLLRLSKIILVPLAFMVAAGIAAYLTVHLLIRNEKTVVIPDLRNRDAVYALEVLTNLNLNAKIKDQRFSSHVPRHHIIDQEPEPGLRLKQGRDVRMIISKGPQTVPVPDFKGTGLAQAQILMDQIGLQSGHVSHIHHKSRPSAQVLSQIPEAGTTVVRGAKVDLLISQGPRKDDYLMKDFTGMVLNQAVITLEHQRLILDSVKYANAPDVPEQTVIDQLPPAGYPVDQGSGVQLTIVRSSSSSHTDRYGFHTLFRHRVSEGFIRRRVRVRFSRATISLDIFDDYVKPAREIWLLLPATLPATIFVYEDEQLIATEQYD